MFFLLPEAKTDFEQEIARLNTTGDNEVALGLPPSQHNSSHSSEIVCMNIEHAVVFVCFSSDSDKTAKWAEGPARAYHPHWQPKEALRWWNLVVADFVFCFFKCSVSSSAVIYQSAAHCSSLSACRAAELVGGKEKWIKFKDWRARAICYIPQTKWVCLMRAHHFSVSSSGLTEHKISSKKHPQVSEDFANTWSQVL